MVGNTNLMVAMLLTALQLFTLELWFCRQLNRRKHFWPGLLLSIGASLAYVCLFPMERLGIFIHVPIYACALLLLLICYEATASVTLFIGTTCCTITNLASLLNSVITLIWPDQFAHFGLDIAPNWKAYTMSVVCFLIMFWLADRSLIRKMRDIGVQKLATVPIVVLSVIMLLVNQILGMFFELYAAPNASTSLHLLEYIWNIICCIFCLSIQFGIFQSSKQEQELEVAHRLIAEREQQYRISKSTMEAVNRKSHDLKYQLMELSNGTGGQKQIQDALALVESFDTNVRTGNETLDVIFTEKNQFCRQNGITFVCMIDGARLNFMETTDQYVLFGNIIDNAINAVGKLPEGMDRSIYINVYTEKQLLLIRTENLFVGELEFRNGLPRTSTGDELNHGYGMTSIRMICEKYGGNVSTKAEGGVFYLNIVLPCT